MNGIESASMPIMMNPSDWQNLTQMSQYTDEQRLALTSKEFEATLVRQYLNDAMKPLIKGFSMKTASPTIFTGDTSQIYWPRALPRAMD
jgi:hypothetical protein